ncbi:hypothetical protein AB2N08_03100 [Massilia aurea]|uniref:hypothetical protein n=1 Tax=Massilia aurea TaxID=373040 RepID=UPI003462DB61
MPGFLVQAGAQVQCAHGGQATPTAPNPRVLLGPAPSVLMATPYVVAGCPFPPPPAANGPCVSGQWLSGTTRVLSNGQPLLVQSSTGVCAPTGTPLLVVVPQARVTAI